MKEIRVAKRYSAALFEVAKRDGILDSVAQRTRDRKTADNGDEPRNRRVDYILSIEEPVVRATGFRPSWERAGP